MTGDPLSRRPLIGACVALVASAAMIWAGSAPFAPGLSGVALLALAGVAAVVATGGVPRRLVGVLLAGAGAVTGGIAVAAQAEAPPAGRLVTLAGGVVLLAVGIVVLLREPRLARFGTRFAAQAERPVDVDPDRAAWQDLDAGRDPTATPSGDGGDDPGAESRPV